MDTFYLGIAEECFPNARIVIDHFHILQHAFKMTDELRLTLQALHKKKFPVKQVMRKSPHKLTDD